MQTNCWLPDILTMAVIVFQIWKFELSVPLLAAMLATKDTKCASFGNDTVFPLGNNERFCYIQCSPILLWHTQTWKVFDFCVFTLFCLVNFSCLSRIIFCDLHFLFTLYPSHYCLLFYHWCSFCIKGLLIWAAVISVTEKTFRPKTTVYLTEIWDAFNS